MTDAAIDESPRAAAPPVRPAAASVVDYAALHPALIPALLFAAAWFVQHSPFDMAIANAFFDPTASDFGWRQSLLLDILGHQTARSLPTIVGGISLAALAAGDAIPRLRPWRALLFTTGCAMLLGAVLINVMKTLTSEHCPSDIVEFGGIVSYAADRAAPFWAATRQSAGHCLPSGHAGGGYALLSLHFAGWAAGRPAWRWGGLAFGIVAGLLFSVVRVMQGAHFASATLWSATVDWTVCALVFRPLLCRPTTPPR
jgi:membrane-associated PAP2 superfamily phosphatase